MTDLLDGFDELSDQMQRDPGEPFPQRGPLGRGFLHPVFPAHALPALDQGDDRFGRVSLADRDQRDRVRLASGDPGGVGDAGANIFEWLDHGALL